MLEIAQSAISPPSMESAMVVNNLLTGLAYLFIATVIFMKKFSVVRRDYEWPFAMFIASGGVYHIGTALGAPDLFQLCVGALMTMVGVATAFVMFHDETLR